MLDTYFGAGSVWVGLTDVNDQEPAAGAYARMEMETSDWNAAAAGDLTNAVIVTFPAPTADWGTMSKAKLFSAASAGTELGSGDLTVAIEVENGAAEPEFLAGNLHVKLT
jgi:hypothetical protein